MSSFEKADVTGFLKKYPEYVKALHLAVQFEEKEGKGLGWEWYNVEIHPTKLIRLVTEGIARVNFKSRSATCYFLKDRESVKRALKPFEART